MQTGLVCLQTSADSLADPCHEAYPGPKANYDPETIAVQNYLKAIKPEVSLLQLAVKNAHET
ncbi:hypothetical protein KIN20_013138 [Parelaphostrongylus tenuis]|uniref:Uncharacterized protein n=1 Tax=Parelaphostrongylus tenuis TaxID=148309 RepID=A0AAD5QNK5_PARTN|nr:hypothetical protein KIN20_013138 [Parelaphostrongylus tenuis]